MGDIPLFVSSIISYVGPILPASNGISPIFLLVTLQCLAHLTLSSLNPAWEVILSLGCSSQWYVLAIVFTFTKPSMVIIYKFITLP